MTFEITIDSDDLLPESLTRYLDLTISADVDPAPDDGWAECDVCGRERELRPVLKQHDDTGQIVRQDVCEACQTELVDAKEKLLTHERLETDPDPDDVPDEIAEAAEAVEQGEDPNEAVDGIRFEDQ